MPTENCSLNNSPLHKTAAKKFTSGFSKGLHPLQPKEAQLETRSLSLPWQYCASQGAAFVCNDAIVLFFQARLVLNEEPLLFCGRTGPWWAGDRKPGSLQLRGENGVPKPLGWTLGCRKRPVSQKEHTVFDPTKRTYLVMSFVGRRQYIYRILRWSRVTE